MLEFVAELLTQEWNGMEWNGMESIQAGKAVFVKEKLHNPGPTPILEELATIIVSVGIKNYIQVR